MYTLFNSRQIPTLYMLSFFLPLPLFLSFSAELFSVFSPISVTQKGILVFKHQKKKGSTFEIFKSCTSEFSYLLLPTYLLLTAMY